MNLNTLPPTYIPTQEDLNYFQQKYFNALDQNINVEKYRKQYELVKDTLVIYNETRQEG
jgi:hypothetical protein